MKGVKSFIKKELTLCVAFAAALISCIFVPPDTRYLAYIDFRTIALLYCLMVVVSGLTKAELFSSLAHKLCRKATSVRALAAVVTALCFFSSMLITNDVALLTFVPFALMIPALAEQDALLRRIIVLQTVAANLGSMLTPVGNPQNLYLHSHYAMSAGDFFSATLPVWTLSLVLIALMCISFPKAGLTVLQDAEQKLSGKLLAVYLLLFMLCLLVVFRVVAWQLMLVILIVALLIFDRKRLLCADFMLLLTFVCFFVFAGNLARIDSVSLWLSRILSGNELLAGAAVSQVISNVPAALLLSGFTDNSRALLLGVDIGGLGTPVASLASLISLKLYSARPGSRPGAFLLRFLVINFALLAILLCFSAIFVE